MDLLLSPSKSDAISRGSRKVKHTISASAVSSTVVKSESPITGGQFPKFAYDPNLSDVASTNGGFSAHRGRLGIPQEQAGLGLQTCQSSIPVGRGIFSR